MKILSIDIGIVNLGYVLADINTNINLEEHFNDGKFSKLIIKLNKNRKELFSDGIKQILLNNIVINECDRVDITNVKHSFVPRHICKLHHDFCIPDYLDHFVQEKRSMFESAEIILLERQPPTGITNVQDLLFSRFRDKVFLVSPNTIHRYFGLPKDYSFRKMESEKLSIDFLKHFVKFNDNIRKHDISDSLLMLLHYHHQKIIDYTNSIVTNEIKRVTDFEKFRL